MMKNFYILAITYVLLHSCQSDGYEDISVFRDVQGFSSSLDSIILENRNSLMFVIDYDELTQRYLGVDADIRRVVIWDNNGRIITEKELVGSGPNKLTSIAGVGFNDSGNVVAISQGEGVEVAVSGEILNSFDFDKEVTYIFPNIAAHVASLGENNIIFGAADNSMFSQTLEYFHKTQTYSCLNIKTGELRNAGGFPVSSNYRKSVFYADRDGKIAVFDNEIYQLMPFDGGLLSISSCDGRSREVKLNPCVWTEVVRSNAGAIESQIQDYQLNSLYKELLVNSNFILAQHVEPQVEDLISSDMVKLNDVDRFRRQYIQIYKMGEGDCIKSLEMPEGVLKMFHFSEDNELRMVKRYDNKEENLVVYKYKINV